MRQWIKAKLYLNILGIIKDDMHRENFWFWSNFTLIWSVSTSFLVVIFSFKIQIELKVDHQYLSEREPKSIFLA